jgi:hypothetical protein
MKSYLLGLLAFLSVEGFTCSAQVIGSDSRGKEVYNFYKSEALSLPISVATSSAKVNYTLLVGEGTQYYIGNDSIHYDPTTKAYSHADSLRLTMAKSTGVNFSLGVGNILSNLSKVSTFHPTYTTSVGIGRNVDAFNNWDSIRTLRYPFYTWNLNVYGSLNNVVIYDINTNTQERRKPLSEGVVAEGTVYLPKCTKTWQYPWLVSVSGSFTYERGNNIESLKNFQENKPVYINAQVISLGDYVGKIGDLKNEHLVRGRVSFPLFPSAIKVFKRASGPEGDLQLCFIPYYSFYGEVSSPFKHLVGLYVNASQGKKLFAKNSTIVSGFGVGIDWDASSSGLSKGSVFVAGSLDIHALFAHTKPAAQ